MTAQATVTDEHGVSPGTIPPSLFCPKNGTGMREGRFGPLTTYTFLHEAMFVLGVNPHQLARLLGTKPVANMYNWLNGTSNPSKGFVIRLVKLLTLNSAGVKLAEAAWIDWEEGEIHWKKGFGPNTHQDQLEENPEAEGPPLVKAGSYRNRETAA